MKLIPDSQRGDPKDRFQIFRRHAAGIREIDFMVRAVEFVTRLFSGGAHFLNGLGFLCIRTGVKHLDARTLTDRLQLHVL